MNFLQGAPRARTLREIYLFRRHVEQDRSPLNVRSMSDHPAAAPRNKGHLANYFLVLTSITLFGAAAVLPSVLFDPVERRPTIEARLNGSQITTQLR